MDTFCFYPNSAPRGNTFASRNWSALLGIVPVANNPVYLFFHTPRNPGPFVLRMALAGYFFFHGAQRTFGWFEGAGWGATMNEWTSPEGLGWPMVLVAMFLVGELLVSASLFLGLFTRLAGLAVVAIMSVKIAFLAQHLASAGVLELPLMLWAAGLAIACLGGGALSTDRAISENLLPVVG